MRSHAEIMKALEGLKNEFGFANPSKITELQLEILLDLRDYLHQIRLLLLKQVSKRKRKKK